MRHILKDLNIFMKNGFSLIEIIAAISILAIGIAGSVALINRTISAANFAHNQFIAWQLAQEGMEVAHNIRNTNWVENASWDDGLDAGTYCANYNSVSLINPCSGGTRDLYVLGNHYLHNPSGTPTDFSRFIEISDGTDGEGVAYKQIKTNVSWADNTVSTEERLYDWK